MSSSRRGEDNPNFRHSGTSRFLGHTSKSIFSNFDFSTTTRIVILETAAMEEPYCSAVISGIICRDSLRFMFNSDCQHGSQRNGWVTETASRLPSKRERPKLSDVAWADLNYRSQTFHLGHIALFQDGGSSGLFFPAKSGPTRFKGFRGWARVRVQVELAQPGPGPCKTRTPAGTGPDPTRKCTGPPQVFVLTVSHTTTVDPRHLEHHNYMYWTADFAAAIVRASGKRDFPLATPQVLKPQ
ncbi:hypothetical protein B0H10DRAFT_1963991 [Mycena sp. CBHHK59/15]|nr:hypothetical protein B0H10DRAFT_1963991 [Mycena sp. CBHHK59/15]